VSRSDVANDHQGPQPSDNSPLTRLQLPARRLYLQHLQSHIAQATRPARSQEDAMTQVRTTRRRPTAADRLELPELLTPSGRKLPW
jgi:hypothetical protein